jgi:FtsP/CotA-like multicopper oxidase with cupredoxin domain
VVRRISGPKAGDVREIDAEIVIGRQGDLVVDDEQASRRHAAVRPIAQGVEVEDLGSANGTFVDGERIAGKLTLARNATLRIGNTEFAIEVSLPQKTIIAAARERPAPDVTVVRPAPAPAPEVTVARRVQPPGPSKGPAGPGSPRPGSPSGAGKHPTTEFPNPRLMAGAVVLVIAVIAALAVLLLGGASSRKQVATALRAQCAKHPPHFINDGFPEPPIVYSHGGVLNYTLKATTTTIRVAGHNWPAMAYNGTIPGPTMVICVGDSLTLHLINDLPLQTNLHLHGMHVSPAGDADNIFVDIHPLTEHTFRYQIPYDQSAGSFWYHPHYHPLVQAEVESGLAGALIVEGSLDDEFPNIPQRLMVIQGGREVLGPPVKLPAKIAAHLKAPPLAGPPDLIVNGVQDPTVKMAPGQLQRWRLVNATSDRELRLAIPGVTFELLAQDGITLHNMVPQSQLLIGPGSREDVLVRGPSAGTYQFASLAFQKCFADCLDPFAGVGQSGAPDPQETLMTVQSSGPAVQVAMPSGQLAYPSYLGDLRDAHVDVYRSLVFARDQNLNIGSVKFPLSGRLYDPNHVDVTMKLGSVEQWTLINPETKASNEWHTFHIHVNPFQVISVNGHKLNYVLYEDNVNLPPGAVIVIRIHPTDFVGKSVFHCHLLFHEDNGMMGVFQILRNPSQSLVNQDRVMYMVPPTRHQLTELLAEAKLAPGSGSLKGVTTYELLCHPLAL